jgi:hypothetical protein
MGAAEDRDQHATLDPQDAAWRARVEGLLTQVLKELRGRRVKGAKRSHSAAARAYETALNAPERYKPTELDMAAARRALNRK